MNTAAPLSPEAVTAESTAPDQVHPSGRNPRGQFAPGNPGGPGRPPKTLPIEREVIALLARSISPEDWVNVAQAAVRKAMEGNMTAIGLLMRTFLNGRLNAAAAAEAIGLPAEVEMLELGCKLHAGWAKLVAANQADQLAEASHGASDARPEVEPRETPDELADRAEPADAPTAEPVMAAVSADHPPRVTPCAERVRGFRVTKGPRPEENGRNRRNAAKTPTRATADSLVKLSG